MVPEYPQLEEMTLRQLRRVASEYRIPRYSRLRKAQLLASIQKVERDGRRQRLSLPQDASQAVMEASKYELGSRELAVATTLGSVDADLPDLPETYEESRIVLMPRDPSLCFAYWDVPVETVLRQRGRQLVLRLYEATADGRAEASEAIATGNLQEYPCEPGTREMYLAVPLSDRAYFAEIGYRRDDGTWLSLARSATMRVPPIYPSAWVEDCFATLDWDRDLQQQVLPALQPPEPSPATLTSARALTALREAGVAPSQRMAGSLLGYSNNLATDGAVSFEAIVGEIDRDALWEGRYLLPEIDRLQEFWPLLSLPEPDRGN